MSKRTTLCVLFLSVIIFGCRYKTITYGDCTIKHYYVAEILKDSYGKVMTSQQAALISVNLLDKGTLNGKSLENRDLKLRLEGEFNTYELSFNFDMAGSTYLTPGEYQLKLICKDTTAHIKAELPKILINAGDNRMIQLGVSQGVMFIDTYTVKKIRRSEWRKMKRENQE